MKITDNIYGEFDITEPILLRLLETPSLLRLKNISQYGIPDKYNEIKNFSRYEHSVGVMLLLRKFNASLVEQIAGLLHDISHFAFSHVADWVFSDGKRGQENYQDNQHREFISKTEIPKILADNGYLPDEILDEENFSLLERPIPDLCADRFDYAIREVYYRFHPVELRSCIEALSNYHNELIFKDEKYAYFFSLYFLELQTEHWAHKKTVARYFYFAEALKAGLAEKVITKNDFLGDEESIILKLEKSNNPTIINFLNKLTKSDFFNKNRRGEHLYKKFRYVDPKVLHGNNLVRLSELNPDFCEKINKNKAINEKGITI